MSFEKGRIIEVYETAQPAFVAANITNCAQIIEIEKQPYSEEFLKKCANGDKVYEIKIKFHVMKSTFHITNLLEIVCIAEPNIFNY